MPSLNDYYNSIQYTNDPVGQQLKAHNDAIAQLTAMQDSGQASPQAIQAQTQQVAAALNNYTNALQGRAPSPIPTAPAMPQPQFAPAPQQNAYNPYQGRTVYPGRQFAALPQTSNPYQGRVVYPGQQQMMPRYGNLGASPMGLGKGRAIQQGLMTGASPLGGRKF